MTPNKTKTKFMSTTDEFDKLANNLLIDIRRTNIVNEDILIIEYANTNMFVKESFITCPLIGSLTMAYGRLSLLKHFDAIGPDKVIYADTDSAVFILKNSVDLRRLDIGHLPGQLVSELGMNENIEKFVSTGPKSYSYICNTGREIVRFNGVQLSLCDNLREIALKSIRKLLLDEGQCLQWSVAM